MSVNTTAGGFTSLEHDAMSRASIITSVVSFSFEVVAIVVLIAFGNVQGSTQTKLILGLLCADAIEMLNTFAWGDATDDPAVCKLQGIISQLAASVFTLCTACVAVELHVGFLLPMQTQVRSLDHRQIAHSGAEEEGDRDARQSAGALRAQKYALGILGLTGIGFVLPFIPYNTYGNAGEWCWIISTRTGTAWRFVTLYVPVWIIIGYISYVYIAMFVTLRRMVFSGTSDDCEPPHHLQAWYWKKVRRLAAYPAILVIGWLPATINRLHDMCSDDSVYPLVMAQIVTQNLIGFLNSFAYGFTGSVRRDVALWLGLLEQSEDEKDEVETSLTVETGLTVETSLT